MSRGRFSTTSLRAAVQPAPTIDVEPRESVQSPPPTPPLSPPEGQTFMATTTKTTVLSCLMKTTTTTTTTTTASAATSGGTQIAWPIANATGGVASSSDGLPTNNRFVESMRASAASTTVQHGERVSNRETVSRWKRAKFGVEGQVMVQRWHKDVDSVWKRVCLACTQSHTLCAGILYRGAAGYTRAQTVMILINGFAFELFMLCLTYSSPPALPIDNATGLPIEDAGPAVVINPIAIIFSATVAAAICIPAMLVFSWAYNPIIYVRLIIWGAKLFVCGPILVCKGGLRRSGCYARVGVAQQHQRKNASPVQEDVRAEVKELTDADGDGVVTNEEVNDMVTYLNANEDFEDVKKVIDTDGDGVVTAQELMAATCGGASAASSAAGARTLTERELAEVKDLIDADADGNISGLEVSDMVEDLNTLDELGDVKKLIDINGDGMVTSTELAHAMRGSGIGETLRPEPPPSAPEDSGSASHGRLGRDDEHVTTPPPSPPDEEDDQEAAAEVTEARRSYSYESLDEGLLKASLTQSWSRGDMDAVKHILIGWTVSYFFFVVLCYFFAAYGCLLFEQPPTRPLGRPPAGNTDELIIAWSLSAFQRFVLHEPTLILAGKGLPVLFASEFCANCCGESIINFLGLAFTIIMEAFKALKA